MWRGLYSEVQIEQVCTTCLEGQCQGTAQASMVGVLFRRGLGSWEVGTYSFAMDSMTNITENITFPQYLWLAVTSLTPQCASCLDIKSFFF